MNTVGENVALIDESGHNNHAFYSNLINENPEFDI